MIDPVFLPDENEGNPLLADLLSRYPLHRVSDFCSILLEGFGASPQPRADPDRLRRPTQPGRGRGSVPPPDAHGTLATYTNFGCRCAPCREARRAYDRERQERRLCGLLSDLNGLGACVGAENRQRAVQPPTAPTDQTNH